MIYPMMINAQSQSAHPQPNVIKQSTVSSTPQTLQYNGGTQSGFTLIEIMVVIVILAILAGLVVPKVVGQSDKARVKTTETAIATVSNTLDMYKIDNSRYPTTAQGLEALSTPPTDARNYPEGGYIKGGYPTDGWENELQYVAPGSDGNPYDLFSLGADGQQGGEGQDADIYAQL
jgi:general secretion pathway protein G